MRIALSLIAASVGATVQTASAYKVMVPESAPAPLATGARTIVFAPPPPPAPPSSDLVVQARRADGKTLTIWTGTLQGTTVHASEATFLGHPDLLDVVISTTWRQGWAGGSHDEHIVLDISGDADRIACRFAGNDEHGSEYTSTRTTTKIVKRSDKPVTFDVRGDVSAKSVNGPGGKGSEQRSSSVVHYAIGDASCGSATP